MKRAELGAKITGQKCVDAPANLPGRKSDKSVAHPHRSDERNRQEKAIHYNRCHSEMRKPSIKAEQRDSFYDVSLRRKVEEVVEKKELTSLEIVQEDLQNMVSGFKADPEEKAPVKTIETWELHRLAKRHSMSVDDAIFIKSVYDRHDKDGTGVLEKGEFRQVVGQILEAHLKDREVAAARAESLIGKSWKTLDKDNSGAVDFSEFLEWFSSSCFEEDVLLTEQERRLRSTAKAFGIDPATVDKVKRVFDDFDSDKSGTVDLLEFTNILHKTLQVPRNLELPASRVKAYWREVDTDESGKVEFEEYLAWWLKYISRSSAGVSMYSIRNMENMVLDPPAYAALASSPNISQSMSFQSSPSHQIS